MSRVTYKCKSVNQAISGQPDGARGDPLCRGSDKLVHLPWWTSHSLHGTKTPKCYEIIALTISLRWDTDFFTKLKCTKVENMSLSKTGCFWLIQNSEWTKLGDCVLNILVYWWDWSQISTYMGYRLKIDFSKSFVISQNFSWNQTGSKDIFSSHNNFKRDIPILDF